MSISTTPAFIKVVENKSWKVPADGSFLKTRLVYKLNETTSAIECIFIRCKDQNMSIYATDKNENPIGAPWEYKAVIEKRNSEEITVRVGSPLPRFDN